VEDRCLLSSYSYAAPVDLDPPGASSSVAYAINTLGQVVGAYSAPGVEHPVLWQPDGSRVDLEDSSAPHVNTIAYDLTDPTDPNAVQVVGVTWTGQATGHVDLWDGEGHLHETTILVSSSYRGPKPVSISNSGVVAGEGLYGFEANGAPIVHAFVWKNGNLQDLHGLISSDPSGFSKATDVIDATSTVPHLQVVADATVPGACGWCSSSVLIDSNDDGILDQSDQVTPLASSGSAIWTAAINDMGKVAGGMDPAGGGISDGSAVVWQVPDGSIFMNLGQFNLGQFNHATPVSYAINHGGWVVGEGGSLDLHAWVWTGSGKIQDLNGLIPKNSGWTQLGSAYGINDAGTIVGQGQKPPGGEHAFLVKLTKGANPAMTPSAASLTDGRTPSQAPAEALVPSTLPRTFAPPSAPGPQASLVLIPLTPATDQDLTLLATESIRSATKRPRLSLWG
jgi:hypothetical protein